MRNHVMTNRRGIYNRIFCLALVIFMLALTGCGKNDAESAPYPVEVDVTKPSTTSSRSSEPVCLVPTADGTDVIKAENVVIDVSNKSEGYFYVKYTGENPDLKMQIACNDGITYTYKMQIGDTVVPLTQGDGDYQVILYEGMGNGQYSALLADVVPVSIDVEYTPYLYPNYYVDFTKDSEAVAIGQTLASECTCDLEVIAAVYDYVIENITYDHEEAETVATNYVPDVDEILETKKGICFDYASLMAAMLRSQRIPTRLEVGYAGDAYHAWVTTYVEDIGWINGVIQFDGADWTLMDPTFAANADSKTLESFVGSGDNYTTKYIY